MKFGIFVKIDKKLITLLILFRYYFLLSYSISNLNTVYILLFIKLILKFFTT